MKIYISGPITGHPLNEVIRSFSEAEERLQEQGYDTVNPLHNGLPATSSWEAHMRADLKLLLECDSIYLLKGFRSSKGAMIEFELAKHLGYNITYQVK